MNAASALARVRADIARHRVLFDLTRDGLGANLCSAATAGVQENLADATTPDGAPLAELSEAYDEWKSFHYPGQGISYLHGLMDNPREVAGEVAVTPDEARVTYGISDEAREQFDWFNAGGPGRPPRPVWGLTRSSIAESDRLLDARFATA